MKMRTNEEFKLWKSSPVYLERKNKYKKEKEELRAYISKYAGKRMELEKQLCKEVHYAQVK